MIGSAVALELVRRRVGRVVLMDARHAGEGMSGRSSALVRMHYSFRPEVELAVLGRRLYAGWLDWTGAPSLLRHTGFVRFVGPGEEGHLRQNAAMQRACGADVELVEGARLRQLLPGWRVDDVALAAYEPMGAYGDGARAAGDMVARARDLGAEYRPRTQVTGLRRHGDQLTGVDTDQGPLAAPVVVCATGPWTSRLLATVGIRVAIEPELHAVAIVRPVQGAAPARLACIDSRTRTYFRPDGGSGWLVGDFSGPRGVDPDDFPQQPGLEELASLVTRAAARVPALGEAELIRGYTGIYDMTPDAHPLLGRMPELDGLVVACGFSGMGFKIAPAVGVVLAEMVSGAPSSVNVSAFRPDRFQQGEAIRVPHAYQDD